MDEVQLLVDSLVAPLTAVVVDTTDGNPIYDCEQKLTLRWQWRAPGRLPVPVGPVDLAFMLRTIDYGLATQQNETLASAQLVSTTVNHLRQSLDTHPDSRETLYVYLHLLRELGSLFDNTNVKWRAYFPGAMRGSSNVRGEYVQGLVLLSQHCYSASLELEDGGSRAALLGECAAAMHEACETAQLVQSERYDQERQQRWQYIKSPKSLSPSTASDPTTRVDEYRREDTRLLRAFIREELGGLAQLGAHALLMRLQKNEMRARLIEAEVHRQGLVAQHSNVHEILAPVIQAVLRDYEAIQQQLVQRPRARLALYSQHMQLYWHTHQQWLLAAADYALYEAQTEENALDYGKRALRRLKQMHTLSEADKEVVQSLYNKAESEFEGLYGAGSTLEMPEIEPFEPVPSQGQPDFGHYAREAWGRFTQQNREVQLALEHLQTLASRGGAQGRTVIIVPECAEVSSRTASLTNAAKIAVMFDRQRHLKWLLGMRQPPERTITLSEKTVQEMQQELDKLELQMQEEKLVVY